MAEEGEEERGEEGASLGSEIWGGLDMLTLELDLLGTRLEFTLGSVLGGGW